MTTATPRQQGSGFSVQEKIFEYLNPKPSTSYLLSLPFFCILNPEP